MLARRGRHLVYSVMSITITKKHTQAALRLLTACGRASWCAMDEVRRARSVPRALARARDDAADTTRSVSTFASRKMPRDRETDIEARSSARPSLRVLSDFMPRAPRGRHATWEHWYAHDGSTATRGATEPARRSHAVRAHDVAREHGRAARTPAAPAPDPARGADA